MIYEYIEWNTDDLLADYINQHNGLIDTAEAKSEFDSPFYLIFGDNTKVKCSDTLSKIFRSLPNDSSDKKAFDIVIRGYEQLITGERGVFALPIFHDKTITCDEYVAPWRDAYGALYNFDGTILKQGANVQSYVVKDNTTQIEANAFCNCDNLEHIEIGSYVDSIGECAFGNCPNLSTIVISRYNSTYKSEDNTIIDKRTKSIICGCKKSTIPSKAKIIGKSSFYGCNLIRDIAIPDSIFKIENAAFYGCSSLEQISLPHSIKEMGENVFVGCNSLERIVINSEITGVDYKTFTQCPNLKVIEVNYTCYDYYKQIFSFTPLISKFKIKETTYKNYIFSFAIMEQDGDIESRFFKIAVSEDENNYLRASQKAVIDAKEIYMSEMLKYHKLPVTFDLRILEDGMWSIVNTQDTEKLADQILGQEKFNGKIYPSYPEKVAERLKFELKDDNGKYLYHYTNLNSCIKILMSNSLLFGKLSELNDINELQHPLYFDDWDVSNTAHEEINRYQQISLTQDGDRRGFDIPAMWGHYSDKGNGVCIIFNKEKLIKVLPPDIYKGAVSYVKDFAPDIIFQSNSGNIIPFSREEIEDYFFKKSNDWAYEQEYRILIRKDSKDNNRYKLELEDAVVGIVIHRDNICDPNDSIFNSNTCRILRNLVGENRVWAYSMGMGNRTLVHPSGRSLWSSIDYDNLIIDV